MPILENIIGKFLLAIIPSAIWTILSIIIMAGLYKVKDKQIPEGYFDASGYIFITNLILMFLLILFFYKENVKLF